MSAFEYLKFVGKSDVGRKRKNNEDSFGMFPELGVWAVADGMGGGDDGEVASAAVVGELGKLADACGIPANGAYAADDVVRAVIAAIDRASAWIYKRALEKRLSGCGSTVVGCVADPTRPGRMVAFHAGDSRLYRLRGRRITQLTTDHSVAEMIGAKDEAKINPMFRGMVFRAVGIKASVEVELTEFDVKTGDRIIICSDGLTKMVSDKRIAAILREQEDVDHAVDALISAANGEGGIDNVTAVLIEVGTLPAPVTKCPLPVNLGETETITSDHATGATGIVIVPSQVERPQPGDSPSDKPHEKNEEAQAVDSESKKESPIAVDNSGKRFHIGRRVVWVMTSALFLIAVIVCAVLAARHENHGAVMMDEVRIDDVNPMRAESESANRAVGGGAPDTLVAALVAKGAKDVSAKTAVRIPLSEPTLAVVQPKIAHGCEELAKCCTAADLATFRQSIVRRLGAGKAAQFSEQMSRAIGSAKAVNRLKSVETSTRFIVDLQYALQAAGDVRADIVGDTSLVRDWDLIAAGEGPADALRLAAARLLKNLPGALH